MWGLKTGGSMQCTLCSGSAVSCRGLISPSCRVLPGVICALSTAKCTHSIGGPRPGKHAAAQAHATCLCSAAALCMAPQVDAKDALSGSTWACAVMGTPVLGCKQRECSWQPGLLLSDYTAWVVTGWDALLGRCFCGVE